MNIGNYLSNSPLVDVQVSANHDSLYGDTDEITEDILMTRIEEAIPYLTNKHNVKIWNMSLGLAIQCEEERFSNLAVFLDELQEKFGIIFTLPAGNADNNKGTHRTWPPDEAIDYADRVEAPGDSVRSITVGAIACAEKPDSIVRINEPASYSCRGLGPSYTIKPDLVHYSGNISLRSGFVDCSGQGIESFDEDGRPKEDVGTSFSAPFVARTCSLIHNSLLPEPSSNLIKALVIHHSYLPLPPVAAIVSLPPLRNAPGSKQGHARCGLHKKRVPASLIRRFAQINCYGGTSRMVREDGGSHCGGSF